MLVLHYFCLFASDLDDNLLFVNAYVSVLDDNFSRLGSCVLPEANSEELVSLERNRGEYSMPRTGEYATALLLRIL
jgi:hypothetical protein